MADEDQDGDAEQVPNDGTTPHEHDADAAGDGMTATCPACGGSGIVHVEQAQSDQPTIIVWGDGFSSVEDAPEVSTGQWIVEFGQAPDAPKAR
jgi:hypothetical protein